MKPIRSLLSSLLARRLSRLAALLLLALALPVMAAERPVLRLAVLQFGTAHWELDHLKRSGLDQANGFELEVRLVADLPASRLALISGSVDGIVGDLLWAQGRYAAGAPLVFVPFSSRLGELVVSEDSPITELADLAGQRIGVAGGPDGYAWQLLQRAAQRQGVALDRSQVQFAAPPLLDQALRRGQLDAVLTFWHFAARLRGEGGVRTAFGMRELLAANGVEADLPMLGYLFAQPWAEQHADLLQRFARAVHQSKRQLAENPQAWQGIRPLMRATDDQVFAALRDAFVAGTPAPLDAERVAALRALLAGSVDAGQAVMPAASFIQAQP
ncbi:ABC transporter substrate-binding protein [Stutzerimonas balearica]|uniref:ABC transporter substrate-binding protein n=1 Tax=Stutzerimonas balearica TaxID=74829 RepID=UPI003F5B2948